MDAQRQTLYLLGMGILPYRKHLEWLLIEGMDAEKIVAFYDNIQMPIPSAKDIDDAKQKVDSLLIPPGVKRALQKSIFKEEHKVVWEKLGYGEIFGKRCGLQEAAWDEVGKILANPVLRICVDSLIISKLHEEKLISMIHSEFSVKLTPESLSIYKLNFANFTDFARKDWIDYLKRLEEDQYAYHRVFTALTRGTDEVLHLCGMPTQKQYSDFLRNVLATSDYKFKHYSRQNSVDADIEARKWAKVGVESGEKFEKYGASDVTDFSKMVQTEFEYVEQEFPTLGDELLTSIRPKVESENDASGKDAAKTTPPIQNPFGGV